MSDAFDFEVDEPKKQTGQLIAVGVLGLLLIVLNVWPDGEEEPEVPYAPVTGAAAAPAVQPEKKERQIAWPELLITDVIRTNPFQMNQDLGEALDSVDNPGSESAEGVDTDDRESSQNDSAAGKLAVTPELDVKKYPVKFVFQGPRGAAAMIKDKVYRVGDEIDGMQIVRIAQNGVTLRPLAVDSSDN